MFPAHVRPVKHCSRADMNGSKDNTSSLKWLFRGLHSVFGTQLDHPFGPLDCLTDTDTHVYTHIKHTVKHTVKHTH